MSIVSCQSQVAFGHVGNAAAVFAMQRLGHEVWPVHTLQFSNHPGYGDHGGDAFDAAHLRGVLAGLERRGALGTCRALLAGYSGSAAAAAVVADAIAVVRDANPAARVCCDPAVGDVDTGLFVPPASAEAVRARLVPAADIVTPNHFELGWLLGEAPGVLPPPAPAGRALARRLGAAVVITGIEPPEDRTRIHSLLVEGDEVTGVACPRVELGRRPDGAGDLFTAVFLVRRLDGGDGPAALAHAAGAVHDVIAETARRGTRELALVAAQDRIVRPEAPVEAFSA